MKDNFSTGSDQYAKFRPAYPEAFFDYLKKILPQNPENAWDCGTGNGQVALKLARQFKKVYATDISQSQMDQAEKVSNVFFSLQPAEKTNFPDNHFDLILVAQAVHWFEFEKFYAEVKRTGKKDSLLVILGYGLLETDPEMEGIVQDFYTNTIGPSWDKERRYIDQHYRTIPFPFEEMDAPGFRNEYDWSLEQFLGYLGTWSAVKHYTKEKGVNPVEERYNEFKKCWGEAEKRKVNFPLLLRIGRIKKINA